MGLQIFSSKSISNILHLPSTSSEPTPNYKHSPAPYNLDFVSV